MVKSLEISYKIHAEDIQLVFEIVQCSQGSKNPNSGLGTSVYKV